jgi:hypothetical protein
MRPNVSCRTWRPGASGRRWFVAVFLLAALSGGCSGDHAGTGDATADPVSLDGGEVGTGPDSAAGLDAADTAAPVDGPGSIDGDQWNLPPPPMNPVARKLLGDGWDLLGTHLTACSHGPSSVGQRWCAVSRAGARLGTGELWVLNVTAAATRPVGCDATSADCRKLSDDLFTGRPIDGPRYPGAHRFSGDTLIFYASARTAPDELFRGSALAWRPGWTAAKPISSSNATLCSAPAFAAVAQCLENVTGLEVGQTLQYDLHAGSVDGGPLPRVASITPNHPQTGQTAADVAFTASGDTLLYSTMAAGPPSLESLFFIKLADIGRVPPTKVAEGVARFAFSADQTRWFYLRDYKYSAHGLSSGRLTTSDFPGGANERPIVGPGVPAGLTGAVGAFQVLVDQMGRDAGLSVLTNLVADKGDHRILPRPDDPAMVVNLATGIRGLPQMSPDLRFSLYSTALAGAITTSDFKVFRTDGGVACTLTSNVTSTLLGVPFNSDASLVFWSEAYDPATDSAQGWVANPFDCSGKRMYSSGVDYWFPRGADLLVYSSESDGQTATLNVAAVVAGQLQPPIVLQRQVQRTYAILPESNGAIFRLVTASPAANGIYHVPLR